MSYFTIAIFFVYTFCLGFTASFFVKNSENFLERNLMRMGFLALILNIVKIPADWRIILALSVIFPIYYLLRNHKKFSFSFRLTKTNLSIFAMLAIFFANFYVYGTGAFNYPYLEDDDSWAHAIGVKYISLEKNVFGEDADGVRYLNPYPPSYDVVMGILHQTNDSVYWTLKFFNALIVSLSTIFFYFFVKELSGSRNKALFAAFALFSIPAFMSHFIWGLSLAVPLYFVAFYAFERIKYDRKWWIVTGLVSVAPLTSSPTHSAYFGMFFVLYFLTKVLLDRKFLLYHAAGGLFGLSLSTIFWYFPMFLRYGFIGTLKDLGIPLGKAASNLSFGGTGDRLYTFSDFFIAHKQNMINNPIGIGIVLSILTFVAVIFMFLKFKDLIKKENQWLVITFVLFVFTLLAVNAVRFPIKLSPFRAWMLLAIPVCILAAQGAFNLMDMSQKSAGKIAKIAVLLILVAGIYFTSTQQKIAVNTATWPPGGFWTSGDEIGSYLWMKDNLPKNSKVFTFVNNGPIVGLDMFTCHWCDDVIEFSKIGFNQTAEETHTWLRQHEYEYLMVDGQTVQKYGIEDSSSKIQELGNSGLFNPVFSNNGGILFRVI
jgi:hypothetical protein